MRMRGCDTNVRSTHTRWRALVWWFPPLCLGHLGRHAVLLKLLNFEVCSGGWRAKAGTVKGDGASPSLLVGESQGSSREALGGSIKVGILEAI